MLKFGLLGDGTIAKHHRYAINKVGDLVSVCDPKYMKRENIPDTNGYPMSCRFFDYPSDRFFEDINYVVICSPSHLHREHIKLALSHDKHIIVEKPMVLPWEPIIDDDRINVVMQLRYANLPMKKAEKVDIVMVRDEEYFKTWKGDPKLTGGVFYNLFIHYLDLAVRLGADFQGIIVSHGEQKRKIDDFNLFKINMPNTYLKMYNETIIHGKGVKPKDIFYINWLLERCNYRFGMGREILNRQIYIPRTVEM